MNENPSPGGRISNAYLLLMTSLFFGAYTVFEAFKYAVERELTLAVAVRVGLCLLLFSVCCFLVNKKNYLNDEHQRKLLRNLDLSFLQAVMVLGALLFWVFLGQALFGSK